MKSQPDTQPWQELHRERAYNGYRKIDRVAYKMPDGTEKDFDIILGGEIAAVLALTPTHEVILAAHYRPGPGKIIFDLPGGDIDAGEQPAEAMARELLEETGYAGNMTEVGTLLHDAYSNRLCHAFVAIDCTKVAQQTKEDSGIIQIKLMSLEEFRELVRSGQMIDVDIAYRGLDYLNLL